VAEEQVAEEPRGFAGFESLVTDLSGLPQPSAPPNVWSRGGRGAPQQPLPAAPQVDDAAYDAIALFQQGRRHQPYLQSWQQPTTVRAATRERSNVFPVVMGALLLLIGLVRVIASFGVGGRDPRDATARWAPTQYTMPGLPSPTLQTPTPGNMPGYMAPLAAPIAQPRAALPPEEKPSVMTQGAVFQSPGQTRYCAAQSIRIQGADKTVNKASTEEIKRYLALFDDYKLRCGNFNRFVAPVAIQQDVESRHVDLEREGAALIHPLEEKPPVAQGALLPDAQVRYCLSQGIRLQGAAKAVNVMSTTEAGSFIALSDDYNLRCTNYRFDPGVMSAVRQDVEARRAELLREGGELIRKPTRF
jgi:hypothetical protein